MRTGALVLVAGLLAGCGAGAVDSAGVAASVSSDVVGCSDYAAPSTPSVCTCASGQSCAANGCYDGKFCHVSTRRCVLPTSVSCPSGGGSSGPSGSTGGTGSCDYAGPDTAAPCTCASGHTCAANGCYGGDYCHLSTHRCVLPTSANCDVGGTSGSSGATGSGHIGPTGGTVSRLSFAAVGDSRPPVIDRTDEYPSSIIEKIYSDIADVDPQFVVATGDYMYATPSTTNGAAQMQLYLQARQAYSGTVFAAMGNHECNGYTAGNCTSSSTSKNYATFMQQLVEPLGHTKPYYRFDVNATDGSWTAKFIVLAMNAWDSAQGSWLQQQLAQPTTYTFIIRHEPEASTNAPGVTPSDDIIRNYPYTLKIVGHTHEFSHAGSREVIVGNGGAPLANSGHYGYATITQTDSGDIQVSEMDYTTNSAIETFTVPK